MSHLIIYIFKFFFLTQAYNISLKNISLIDMLQNLYNLQKYNLFFIQYKRESPKKTQTLQNPYKVCMYSNS